MGGQAEAKNPGGVIAEVAAQPRKEGGAEYRQTARYIELTGIVQGVGFRPFVYNLAVGHGLRGWVRNTSAGVQMQVEGSPEALDAFVHGLTAQAPPLARIETIKITETAPDGHERFVIEESLAQEGAYQLVSPDIATCLDCLGELFDCRNRRYGYPFTNCTNCGPRFTIIEDIPYDRAKTTMREFRMCAQCQAEYEDTTNRRFHAQPNACPVCGPHLWLVDPTGAVMASSGAAGTRGTTEVVTTARDSDVIRDVVNLLQEGAIVALKGLGGFHLACDATNAAAVECLRQRKHRPHKPFAVMMATLEEIQSHCHVTPAEARLLTSSPSPIVLLQWRSASTVVQGAAPNNRYLGVMLPYTPLHHLLLRAVGRPLIMTSGNLSEEPIAKDNDEALQRLGGLADAFLLHNRGIYARYDDSVWFVPLPEGGQCAPLHHGDAAQPPPLRYGDATQPIRRARGYAPHPVRMGFGMGNILACGAELKNTFCLTRDRYAFVSQHIGDLENLETLDHFEATVRLYEHLFRAPPVALACDLHPDYLATRYAEKRAREEGLPLVSVQHHHAHIASCLADNDWPPESGRVIGVALDGTGLGSDGRIWGGEFLIADYHSFERFGHLEYLPLPGGDAATRKPYRIALAYLYRCLGKIPDLPFIVPSATLQGRFAAAVPPAEVEIVRRMVEGGINTPLTSSCGRLFDAVSALLGICQETSYEAQAAIELEMAAGDLSYGDGKAYPFLIEMDEGRRVVRLEPLLKALVQDLNAGVPVPEIGAAFHHTVAEMVARMCCLMREETGLNVVGLSGGCFQNRQLLRLAVKALQVQGFHVLLHHQVPCNDGGLSLGQALVAHFQMEFLKSCA